VKFLLIKLNHLGDTLLLTPTIRFLRERYPDARIDVMVRSSCEVMLQSNPDIDHVVGLGHVEKSSRSLGKTLVEVLRALRRVFLRRYDYTFALSDSDRSVAWMLLSAAKIRGMNSLRISKSWKRFCANRLSHFDWSKEHQVLRDFRTVTDVLGIVAEPGPLRFCATDPLAAVLAKIDFSIPPGGYVVIHPTSRWAFKHWSAERWALVADEIVRQRSMSVVLSSGPAEYELRYVKDILSAASERHAVTEGRLTIPEVATLLAGSAAFIGVDTVVTHLAAAMQAPTVALFGPSSEWSWHPWQCRHELVLGECECKRTRGFVCDKSKIYPCMEKITVDAVTQAAGRLLSGSDDQTRSCPQYRFSASSPAADPSPRPAPSATKSSERTRSSPDSDSTTHPTS
jgi:heptosyltransferase-3